MESWKEERWLCAILEAINIKREEIIPANRIPANRIPANRIPANRIPVNRIPANFHLSTIP